MFNKLTKLVRSSLLVNFYSFYGNWKMMRFVREQLITGRSYKSGSNEPDGQPIPGPKQTK